MVNNETNINIGFIRAKAVRGRANNITRIIKAEFCETIFLLSDLAKKVGNRVIPSIQFRISFFVA